MRNHIQPGNSLDFVAPVGGVASGKTAKEGAIIHIPSTSAAEGEGYSGDVVGCFEVDAATGQAWIKGEVLFWNDTTKVWTKTATDATKGAYSIKPKASGDARGSIRLVPSI